MNLENYDKYCKEMMCFLELFKEDIKMIEVSIKDINELEIFYLG